MPAVLYRRERPSEIPAPNVEVQLARDIGMVAARRHQSARDEDGAVKIPDKMRIDWLQKREWWTIVCSSRRTIDLRWGSWPSILRPTVRLAIDAAICAEQKK